MPKQSPDGMLRYDTNDLDDLAVLVDRGLIWQGGPRATEKAVNAIIRGDIPRPTRNVPAYIDEALDAAGVARSQEPVAPPAEPSPEDPLDAPDA